MVEDEAIYKTKNKYRCEICGKATDKVICNDCTELETSFNKLKKTNTVKAKQWLKNQLKQLKE
jgi:ribosomal protein L37AE/L43A